MGATLVSLHTYPVKSCRGIELRESVLLETGLTDDREWMLVRPNGRFVTQRELPRMALIETTLGREGLKLSASGAGTVEVPREKSGESLPVVVWKFSGRGIDCGDEPARWVSEFLGTPLRLVRFDRDVPRTCNPEWTGDVHATTLFADGYPVLIISRASLAELNARLEKPLPMERFRPNLVIEDVEAFDEDRIHELRVRGIALRLVKPCTRCSITTTDQQRGELDGVEPLRTLKEFRFDRELRGVTFGQNAIVVSGAGEKLQVGDSFEVAWK